MPSIVFFTISNRRTAATRIGLMDSTVAVEVVVGCRDVASLRDAEEGHGDGRYAWASPQCPVARPVATLRGFAAGMVLIAPDSTSHVSDMLALPPQTVLSLIASERRHARSAINTIQAERSVVEYDDIRKAEDVLVHDLSFRGLLRP
jgi:hypothetical protein